MKTIKIKTASTGKAVAKVAGLLFCTSLFGLTLAAPSEAQQFVLGDSSTSNQPIFYMMYLSYGGNWTYTYRAYWRAWRMGKMESGSWASSPIPQLPTPPPPSGNPYPDAPGGPEPLTILGSAMGAGGLVLLKKRRSEKDKLA